MKDDTARHSSPIVHVIVGSSLRWLDFGPNPRFHSGQGRRRLNPEENEGVEDPDVSKSDRDSINSTSEPTRYSPVMGAGTAAVLAEAV